MPGAKVRWRQSDEDRLEVVDHGTVWFGGDDDIIAAAEVIEPASLTELRRALARYRSRMYDGEYRLRVFDASAEDLEEFEELYQARDVELELVHNHTFVVLTVALGPDEPALDRWDLTEVLIPLLKRHRGLVVGFEADEQPKNGTLYYLTVEISPRGRTVGDAMQIGADLLDLWHASLGGGLTPGTVANLLRARRPELLVGQPESEWFEAKQAPYALGDDLQEVELAKDVSALANRPEGGLLVIGLVTSRRNGVDTVTKVRTQPMERLAPRRYRQALDRWIFPPLQDPLVEAVEVEPGRGVLWILVQPQPDSLWPFLVVGAIKEGKLLGNHFSLVRRRGDDTMVDPAAVVHGLLVAGRVALASAPRGSAPCMDDDVDVLRARTPIRGLRVLAPNVRKPWLFTSGTRSSLTKTRMTRGASRSRTTTVAENVKRSRSWS